MRKHDKHERCGPAASGLDTGRLFSSRIDDVDCTKFAAYVHVVVVLVYDA